MARGIDLEAVTPRFASKSIGCCKKFPGRNSIKGIATLTHWLTELSKEICERLEKDEIENSRVAKQIVVSFTQQFDKEEVASTRCIPLNNIDVEIIAQDALGVIKRNTEVFFKNEQNTVILNPLTLLGISAGKFDDINQQKRNTIKDLFSKAIVSDTTKKCENESKESGQVLKPTNKKSDRKVGNIKSFFSASKEDLNAKDDVDEEAEPMDDEFNSKIMGSLEEDATVEEVTDSKLILEDASSIEITNFISASVLHEENEATVASMANPMTNSSFADQEEKEHEKPGPSNQSDYKSTYAEFLRPTIPEDFFETCTQCNKKLLIVEIQSHMDMHLAFKLSEEQRLEFRSQSLRTKPSASPPVAKKPKLDRNTNLNVSSSGGSKIARNTNSSSSVGGSGNSSSSQGSLTKYFEQKKEDANEMQVKCDECGKFIKIESVAEHSDYHTAKKLQMEINSLSASALISSASSKETKTKSKTDSTSKKRSIASFFTTTN